VTYGDSVYDLTAFAKHHFEDKLKLAAGGPLEPYWEMYPSHKSGNAPEILAKHKIGTLHPDDMCPVVPAEPATDLPTLRRAEVQKEARENKKVWVTYGDGVYDLTAFARSHPGGSDKLMMAAGGPIEPFWEMYPFHKEEKIKSLLA